MSLYIYIYIDQFSPSFHHKQINIYIYIKPSSIWCFVNWRWPAKKSCNFAAWPIPFFRGFHRAQGRNGYPKSFGSSFSYQNCNGLEVNSQCAGQMFISSWWISTYIYIYMYTSLYTPLFPKAGWFRTHIVVGQLPIASRLWKIQGIAGSEITVYLWLNTHVFHCSIPIYHILFDNCWLARSHQYPHHIRSCLLNMTMNVP